jgi:hypothetical protein
MGVVIEICVKYPGGPTRMTVTDMPGFPPSSLFLLSLIYGRNNPN